MKTELKEIYKCDHCNKIYQMKHYCVYHEKICRRNKDNERPCFSCEFLTKKEVEFFTGYGDGDGNEKSEKSELLFCSKKEVCLYTPHHEVKGNFLETIDFENEPMPKNCEFKY